MDEILQAKIKNALVIGGGSKFGQTLSTELQCRGFEVYGISGSASSDKILQVNWTDCFIQDFEKFLRKLPKLELVIFNQNFMALTEHYWQLNSTSVLDVWQQSKQWQQSFYVNCILPVHVLHTLADTQKIDNHGCIAWLLSRSIFMPSQKSLDYVGQKYQNYQTMQHFANNNTQTFVGICPGLLNSEIYQSRAEQLVDLLQQPNLKEKSGKFFVYDCDNNTFDIYKNE